MVPRVHRAALADLPGDERDALFEAAQRVAAAVEAGLGAGGSWVSLNDKVSQSVPHVHVHVIPRTKGDGLRGFFWPRTKYADDAEAEGVASRIRAARSRFERGSPDVRSSGSWGPVESFEGRIAVVTGGGTGMGRELVVQLAAEGCHVAACDVNPETLEEMADLARAGVPEGTLVTTHICDVSDAMAMDAFRDEVLAQHDTNHVNLVFNNAGIAGGGSFVMSEPKEWDLTFGVCWGGVYNGCRSFLPLLIASDSGYLVNTSSVNGFWATLGLGIPHTAYSAAKFAVKGFSEALLQDLKLNAPHVKVAVVMPGHIGTQIVTNTMRVHGLEAPDDPDAAALFEAMQANFVENAPMSAAEAATVILDGVRAGKWRILVGDDAHKLDEMVRADPEGVYESGFSLSTMLGGDPS